MPKCYTSRVSDGVGVRSKEGRKFALKIIRKERITREQELVLGAELALLRRLRHPSLLQLVDELDTPVEWYFIMELFKVRITGAVLDRIVINY